MSLSTELARLLSEYDEWLLSENPFLATMLGDHRFNHLLGENGPARIEKDAIAYKNFLVKVDALPSENMDQDDLLTASILKKGLENALEGVDLGVHLLCVDHMSGPQINLPHLCQIHPFRDKKDYEDFLSRLVQIPENLDGDIAILRLGIDKGLTNPTFSIRQAIEQTRALIDNIQSPFFLPITGQKPDFQGKGEIFEAISEAIKGKIWPSLSKFADFLEKEYLPVCTDDPGLCHRPGGDRIYKFLVAQHTAPGLKPEEIHKIGLSEVSRVQKEMLTIMKAVDFKGELSDFFNMLKSDSRFLASSREEYMNFFESILKAMEEKIPQYFKTLPKYPYEVKPMESFREKNAPTAYYMPGPLDGSRPGIYYVNTYEWEKRSTYTLEALSFHEAVPGHHFQISLSRELAELPLVRKLAHYTAYIEGWALYTELLAREMGFYTDPYSDFGRLTFDAWRSARLVIDTGLHHLGWDMETARKYLRDNTSLSEPDIAAEIDRYCVMPGQALSYKIGQIQMIKLRKLAMDRLGEAFDYGEFHDTILLSGALPLDILEEKVVEWVEKVISQNRETNSAVEQGING